MNSDISKVKPSLKATLDYGKPSSVFDSPGFPIKIKKETPDSCEEVVDGGNDSVFADRGNIVQVKIEPSSDENSCSYSKYEKDEPDIKGPITSYSQYQEYIQEYHDKYDSYLSLRKVLEGYSDEFEKPTVELKDAKARGDMDRYNEIWEQIGESYRRCKPRCDRMKKIFLVLLEELRSIKQRIKDFVDEQEHRKRLKAGNLTPEDTYKDPNIQAGNRANRQGSSDVGFQKGNNQALPQTGQRSSDEVPLGNPSYLLEKSDKLGERIRHNRKHPGRDFHARELSSVHKYKSHGSSENNRSVPWHASKEETNCGMVSHPFKDNKGQTPHSCEEVANRGKDSVFADSDNRDQQKRESSSDENNCSYSKYDKDEPEIKGPIKSYSQYYEYVQEYNDKHGSYLSLKKILEGYRDELKKRAIEREDAKAGGDIDRYKEIREQTMESYKPRCDRMKKIFLVLQAELPSIKQRIKDFDEERRKRLKAGNLTHESFSPSTDVQMFEKSRSLSPFEFTEGTYKDPNIQAGNRADRQGSSDVGFQKGNNQALPQTGQRSSDEIPLGNPSYPLEKLDITEFPPEDMISDISEGSFKHTNTSEDKNSDITKVNSSLKTTLDSRKPSSAFSSPEFASNLESISKKNVDNPFEYSTKSRSRVEQILESKGQTPHSCEEVADGGKNSVSADRDNRDQQKRESSSDENHCSYSKYDKDEPELKGPITSYPQYEEYVQELQDKFDSYLSLDKILEGYSDESKKLAVEYEDAKASGDIERYNEIAEQIKETDRRCRAAESEKLKKIYFVLQAELWSIKQRIHDFVEEYNIGCLSSLELWGDT